MDPLLNVALLVHVCEQIEGRKKLQKIVHILQESGEPFREWFGMLHYGPYSSELKGELDLLVEGGLITEGKKLQGGYQTFVYSPGEKLDKLLDAVEAKREPSWTQAAQDLNDLSAQMLEAVSTILFLQKRGFKDDRLKDRFEKIKPQLATLFDNAQKLAAKYVPTAA